MIYIATRYVAESGTIIKHIYGPYPNRSAARKEIKEMTERLTPSQASRLEASTHKPIQVPSE